MRPPGANVLVEQSGPRRILTVIFGEGGSLSAAESLPGRYPSPKKPRNHSEFDVEALGSGPRGRRFKSSRPDHLERQASPMKRPSNGPFSLYGQSWGRLGDIGVNRAR